MTEQKDSIVPSEEELIRQAGQGDMMAFETVVQRYDSKVLAIAMSYTRDEDEAKDIYQEVFIRVHRALPKFEFRSKFSTWLYRITSNVCLTHRTRKSRHQHVSIDQPVLSEDGEYSLADTLADSSDTEGSVLQDELSRELMTAMQALSPKQKLVFTLRHYHGYKLREIAEMMNCAEGTVKRHLFSATERMRQQLAQSSVTR